MTVVPFRKQRLLSAKAIGMWNKDVALNQLQSAPSPPPPPPPLLRLRLPLVRHRRPRVALILCLQVETRFGMGLTNFDQLGP